jgi:hypothetical protein
MPRPRKDGKPAARAIRIGVERTSGAGKKWRVRSYAPTDGAPYGRVVYVSPTTGKPTSKVPEDGQTLDTVFDQVERALTQKVAMGTGTNGNGKPDVCRRDLRAVSEMYLDYLRSKGRDDDYIANRKSMLRKWILPSIGSVLVADWCSEHSQGVITKARAGELGGDRVADIGSTLSGMRKTAWRKRPGGRWLSRDENPMEDVEYGRGATRQGAGRNYLPPQKRPATSSVEEAIQTSVQVALPQPVHRHGTRAPHQLPATRTGCPRPRLGPAITQRHRMLQQSVNRSRIRRGLLRTHRRLVIHLVSTRTSKRCNNLELTTTERLHPPLLRPRQVGPAAVGGLGCSSPRWCWPHWSAAW